MKGRRLERVERRRLLVEQNLISEGRTGRTRPAMSRRGCGTLFGTLFLVISGLVAVAVGLH